MEKPISVKVEEFRMAISRLCNDCGIPTILLEPLIKDLYTEIHSINVQLAEKEKKEWEEAQEKNE